MAYVNKMDIMGADFYRVVQMMKDRLKCNAVPIQLPIGAEETFKGIIDLVEMKAYVYYDDLGKDIRCEEIPEDMLEQAQQYRAELVEHVAELDDALMEKYLAEEEITIPEIKDCIRKSTIANHMVPIVCGTSYRNKACRSCWTPSWTICPPPRTCPLSRAPTRTPRKRLCAILLTKSPSRPWPSRLPQTPMWASCASSGSIPVR
jgi:elongation factor G